MAQGLSRRALALISVACLLLFAVDTALVVTNHVLPFDVPVELAVQQAALGPYRYAMEATNAVAGGWQTVVALVAVGLFAAFNRRAGWLLALGALASVIDNAIKVLVGRVRPTPNLVDVIAPNPGYSFPSGHAVFYTWLAFMVAAALAPGLPIAGRRLVWAAALMLAATGCLGRVWAGAHWPSDVLGGFLLGLGWSAFVLWVPERFLPTPHRGWLRRSRVEV